MAKRSFGGTNQTLNVSGNAAGINQVAGDNNTVTATGTVSIGTPDDVLQALSAIQAALSKNPSTQILSAAAVQQAKSSEPDKTAIGSHLKSALDIAKTADGWVDLAKQLGPHVRTVVSWLGAAGAAVLL